MTNNLRYPAAYFSLCHSQMVKLCQDTQGVCPPKDHSERFHGFTFSPTTDHCFKASSLASSCNSVKKEMHENIRHINRNSNSELPQKSYGPAENAWRYLSHHKTKFADRFPNRSQVDPIQTCILNRFFSGLVALVSSLTLLWLISDKLGVGSRMSKKRRTRNGQTS